MKNNIPLEDFYAIKSAQAQALYMRALADKAYAEQKQAELNYENITLLIYMKHGLSNNEKIDQDGNIIWGKDKDAVKDSLVINKTEEKVV